MKAHINITYRDKDNNIIENPTEGQKVFSPETGKLYIYTNDGWEEIQAEGGLQLSLYDMNKQLIAQQKPLTNEQIEKAKEDIKEFMIQKANAFYMLLCRDINYYTLFHCVENVVGYDSYPAAADEVIECLKYVGEIKAIDVLKNEPAIEIWVHGDGDPVAMYLFSYDEGVITCTL